MNIEIIKSKRKSIAIEIKLDLRIIVRAPFSMSDRRIKKFISEKSDWINKNIEVVKTRIAAETEKEKQPKFTDAEITEMVKEAKASLCPLVEYFSNVIGVSYGKITVRHQISRWGSCSSKGSLNLNCLLVLCPDDVKNYVIIHELCHLKELNHSKQFWTLVESYCPNYKKCKGWLKTNGTEMIRRLR